MSKVRSDNISNRADDGAPALVYGVEVPVGYGITGAGGIDITGIATAASFSGATGSFTGDVDIADKIIHTGDTNTAIRFPAADTFTIETAGSERLRITSGGNIGIGGLTNPQDYHANANSLVSSGGITLANTSGGYIYFADSATGTGEYVGQIGYDHGSDYMNFVVNNGERLRILSDGTIATGGLSATPGTVAAGSYIQAAANAGFFSNGYDGKFGTSSNHPVYFQVNGSSKASITSAGNLSITDGNLVIGTSGHGIDFSAAGNAGGMTSELLDDYEEGTWTPTLGGNASYDIRVGTYTKIGNLVYAYCRIRPTSLGTGSDDTISGLPFNPNGSDNSGVMIGYYDGSAVSSVELGGALNTNGSIGLYTKTSATNNTGTTTFFQNNCRIYLSTVYQTDS